MGADLVRHPRAAALAHPQRLEPPAVDLRLERVIGRAVKAHQAAGLGDVAELVDQGEQTHSLTEQHVILCHRVLLSALLWLAPRSVSERADAPAMAGASGFQQLLALPKVSGELGVSPR